jgi:hypothetical protein
MASLGASGKFKGTPHLMHSSQYETRNPQQLARRAVYRVVNHQEAGLFDTMTGATVWALKNLKGWDWTIEPATSAIPQ